MQIKIFNFFGLRGQIKKANEELDETEFALRQFTVYPNKANILDVLNEAKDLCNVLEGIAKVKYGVNLEEIKGNKHNKLVRTVKLIDKIDPKLSFEDRIKEYERLRGEL